MVRKVENKTKISNYETSWFNPRGQKGLICTRDNITMARRGQNGWICTRESIVVSERGGFAHVGWNAPDNCRLLCRHNRHHCRLRRVTSTICHIGRQAAAAELTPLRSVRPSYRLLRPRSRENLCPAGTSHFPRPWAGHVRRGWPPARLSMASVLKTVEPCRQKILRRS